MDAAMSMSRALGSRFLEGAEGPFVRNVMTFINREERILLWTPSTRSVCLSQPPHLDLLYLPFISNFDVAANHSVALFFGAAL